MRVPRIDELLNWGMKLDRVEGRLAAGHGRRAQPPRIVHADGDATGRELAITLDRQGAASTVFGFSITVSCLI
ncbi:MAG: hypothetical protein R3C45_19215 [Phycisphaerales bacterium]